MSTEVTTVMMNVTISAFEGRKFYGHTIDKFGGDTGNALPEMKYHTSWDWLMPVVDKIAKMVAMCEIEIPKNEYELDAFSLIRRHIYATIETIHNDVYQFVLWYNQQKQTNE